MATLSSALRKQLENAVRDARIITDQAATDAVERLGIAVAEAPPYLSEEQKALRRRLRAHARSLGDRRDPATGTMATARLEEAAAYEHWHRMLFGRFLVERDLLIHPTLGVSISRGDLKELAEEQGFTDEWALVERIAAPSLPAVFKPDDPVLALELDPHFQARLRALVTALPEEIFVADDSLGWTYQFWRAAERNAVNDRQVKIGADELPAVTQLFTEPYMVKFLLHNTLGAWWAGKVLAAHAELARGAPDENALRAACALPGIEWDHLRFARNEDGGAWRPAAGTFPGWPAQAAEITYLDPCCGSGHFLVEAFRILAALRQEEEGLSPEKAARAVLRDNLHGLEIDGRCVQIAAFSVALAAWRLAGGPVSLPVPHIAWVGAPPPLPKAEFVALANGDAELLRGLAALHDLFRQAPLLGSLIELTGGDLVDPARVARLDQSIAALVEKMRGAEPERAEGALAARGMADAAAILARRYVMLATNVPYLGRGKQTSLLADYIGRAFSNSKADLATAMFSRISRLTENGGSLAVVTPQNWLFLKSFENLRRPLLRELLLNFIIGLGEEAWEFYGDRGPLALLNCWSNRSPGPNETHFSIDVTSIPSRLEKTKAIANGPIVVLSQADQLRNPDSIITFEPLRRGALLSQYCRSVEGLSTGDADRFIRSCWEVPWQSHGYVPYQATPDAHNYYSGRSTVVLWENGQGAMAGSTAARVQGHDAWGKQGVLVGMMRYIPTTIYLGEIHEKITAALIPNVARDLAPLYAFISSPEYRQEIKKLDTRHSTATATFTKVPVDIQFWRQAAAEQFPDGFPEPYSADPTQWLFHGHPRYAEPGTELQVALARLAGYRWPAETDPEMRLSAQARAHIAEVATLPEADAGGLLALVPVLGERPLADRLRVYCAASWGDAWTQGNEAALIAGACDRAKDKPPKQLTFDAWLRSHAARQHAKLFHDRPFLWWITDGRADGFTAVAHYHRLDRGNLERLAYTMLGDWITRLGDDPRAEAARILQAKLADILEGEKPYDIFVRWKPLGSQPIGWNPDLDDGVRLNIRPFIEAGALAHVPNVKYGVDRGKDVASAPWYHLFHGERCNHHHTTLAEKRAVRERPPQ